MKIVLLNDSIYKYATLNPTAVGGAERQQWLLARALAATGWSVAVGISDGLEAGAREKIEGVEFIGVGRDHAHILSAWNRFLISQRPDWWYWRCASHLLGPAFALAKFLGVRTIFSAALDPDVNPRRALFQRSRWWPLYAWGLSWSDRIFVQHGGQLAQLRSNLRSKSFVVPSIAGETIDGQSHFKRAKSVAWVGQLKQPKRPDLLVEIARKSTGIHFIVCGGPSSFMSPSGYSQSIIDGLRQLPNVEYRGQVPPHEALDIIANAALLLSTSDEEGFPNTFLQAWSTGTPVVSLKIDPDGIIAQNGLGTVSNTAEAAIREIEALIHSPEKREIIAARARRYVNDHHSEAAVTALFNRAIEGERHKRACVSQRLPT